MLDESITDLLGLTRKKLRPDTVRGFFFSGVGVNPCSAFVSVFLSAVAVLRHLCALTSVFSRRTASRLVVAGL